MVPPLVCGEAECPAAPRTRGDGPVYTSRRDWSKACSPHPRGWSHGVVSGGDCQHLLPHPRGWSQRPRTLRRGGRLLPPHPRGWSRLPARAPLHRVLLPAPAGMVPTPSPGRSASRTAPRTRGDGPGPAGASARGTALSRPTEPTVPATTSGSRTSATSGHPRRRTGRNRPPVRTESNAVGPWPSPALHGGRHRPTGSQDRRGVPRRRLQAVYRVAP